MVLATDDDVSLAAFIYETPEEVRNLTRSLDLHVIGFDAGDQTRSATLQRGRSSTFNVENVNVFRIDGMMS